MPSNFIQSRLGGLEEAEIQPMPTRLAPPRKPGFLESFVSGLDPRNVVASIADTGGDILTHLDRPRGAIKGSQVESQDSGSFFSMLGDAAQGAVRGFTNPDQYPASGFLEGAIADPVNFIPGSMLPGILRTSSNPAKWGDDILQEASRLDLDRRLRDLNKQLERAYEGMRSQQRFPNDDELFEIQRIKDEMYQLVYGQNESDFLAQFDDVLNPQGRPRMMGVSAGGGKFDNTS